MPNRRVPYRARAAADSPSRRPATLADRMRLPAIRVTPIRLAIGIAFVGSAGLIAFAIHRDRDTTQIPMLSSGFAVLGLALASMSLACLIQLWRAATAGATGRAMALGIVGGVIGLGAIGCFTATALLALLWKAGA